MVIGFNQYLDYRMKEKGLNYSTIADMTGVAHTTISRYAKGKMGVTLEKAMIIGKLLEGSYGQFYEKMTGRYYPENTVGIHQTRLFFPGVKDVEEFEQKFQDNPERGCSKLADEVTEIYQKAIKDGIIEDIIDPDGIECTSREIKRMILSIPFLRSTIHYPEKITMPDVISICDGGGAIIQDDVHLCCREIIEKIVSEGDRTTLYNEFTAVNAIPLTKIIGEVKFQQVLQADNYQGISGKFFQLCTLAVENNRYNYDHPITPGRLLILISRWRKALNIQPSNWMEDMLVFH